MNLTMLDVVIRSAVCMGYKVIGDLQAAEFMIDLPDGGERRISVLWEENSLDRLNPWNTFVCVHEPGESPQIESAIPADEFSIQWMLKEASK